MTNRGIKDEAFVRRALEEADFDLGRWIARQDNFNMNKDIDPVVKAAVVVAAAIFAEKYPSAVSSNDVARALEITTQKDARDFIDSIKLP